MSGTPLPPCAHAAPCSRLSYFAHASLRIAGDIAVFSSVAWGSQFVNPSGWMSLFLFSLVTKGVRRFFTLQSQFHQQVWTCVHYLNISLVLLVNSTEECHLCRELYLEWCDRRLDKTTPVLDFHWKVCAAHSNGRNALSVAMKTLTIVCTCLVYVDIFI